MAWEHQDYDRTLRLGEQQKDFSHRMKEKELRQKAEDTAETRGGGRVGKELMLS